MYKKNKRGQLFLLSTFMILFGLLFIYSLETGNTYIVKSAKTGILNNMIYETCQVGKMSNGSYLDSRYSELSSSISTYCTDLGYTCTLSIVKQGSAPTNLSNLNYTHYDYSILYDNFDYKYEGSFNC